MKREGRSSLDEERLVAGLRRGDAAAVEEIYAQYGRIVFAYLLKTLPDRGDAEDVQQKVFTEVWSRGAAYDPQRGSLLAWIMQTARSRAIDQMRRRRPEPVEKIEDFPTDQLIESGFTDVIIDHWQIAQLLQRLPKDEADVLRERFYRDKSQSQIAAETGMPLGTVKMRMVDGLRRMRQMLEAEDALT